MEPHNPKSFAPEVSLCNALAVGDVIVSCSVWVAIVLLLLLVLGPLLFRFVLRPIRIRQLLNHRRQGHRRRLIRDGASQEEVENYAEHPAHLSFAQHKHLNMDEETSKYSRRAVFAAERAKKGERETRNV